MTGFAIRAAADRAHEWSLLFADRVFGGSEPAPPAERWLLRYLGVVVLLAAVIVARRPDAVTNPQFWAEDGYIFFSENLTLGFPRALAKFYQGFPYLTHRLIAWAGGLVPFSAAPRVYTTSAIAVTALVLASFALPNFRHLVRSDALRVFFGVAALSLPFDQEVLSTPTNLSWFIAVGLALLSVARLPRAAWRIALLAGAGCTAVFSTPLAVLTLPLWLLRAWRGLQRRNRHEMVCAFALIMAFAVVVFMTGNLGRDQRYSSALTLRHYLIFVCDRVAALVFPVTLAPVSHATNSAAMTAVAAGLTALLLAACAAGGFRRLPAVLVALYFFLGSLLGLGFGRPTLLFLVWYAVPYRYTVFPAIMLVLAVVAALDGLPAGQPRRLSTLGVAVVLAAAWASRFALPPLRDLDWPGYAVLIEKKIQSGSRFPLTIPMNPSWAPLKLDPAQPRSDAPPESGAN